MSAPGSDLLAGVAPSYPNPALALGGCRVAGAVTRAASGDGAECLIAGRLVGEVGPDRVAAAYASNGDAASALAPLRGEFVALLWHPLRRELVVARDQLGGRGLHYRTTARGLLFAEEVRDLLGLVDSTPEPDARAVGLMLARGLLPAGRTLYDGVARLSPGALLRWRHGRVAVDTWWQPRYEGVRDGTPEELAQRTVEAMDRAVARAAGGERVGVMLSGGLDSAAVAAGAAQRGPPPVGYSCVFPDHPEIDESKKLDAVVEALGMAGVRREISGGSALGGSLGYLEHWKLPVASPNHFVWGPLLERAAADGVGVMLDGEGGDEVFDVSGYAVADALRGGRIASALALARLAAGTSNRSAVWRALLRHGVKGAAPRSVHRFGAPQADFDRWEWKAGRGPLWWRHQASLLTRMRETLDAHGYLRRRAWEAGIEGRHPFLHDVDLMETVLALPPEPRFHAELDRVLLRQGLAGRVPDAVRLVHDKRSFDGLLRTAMEGGDAALIRELVEDRGAEVRSFVEPGALGNDLRALWRAGVVETWLRSLADPGFPGRLAERCGLGVAERDPSVYPPALHLPTRRQQ